MTIEEFTSALSKKGISYEIRDDKVIITNDVYDVYLKDFKTIPPNTEFYNKGDVIWAEVESLPSGLKFNNSNVSLIDVNIIPTDVEFNNKGNVNLKSTGIKYIDQWEGNIKGINPKSLLNGMVKSGLFL